MFTAVLFIIAPKWKQPKRLSIDECTNEMQYIHIIGYYSDIIIKINEVLIQTTTQMNLEKLVQVKAARHKSPYIL